MGKYSYKTIDRRNKVKSLVIQKVPITTIAKALKVSRQTIYDDLKAIKKEDMSFLKSVDAITLAREYQNEINEVKRKIWEETRKENPSMTKISAYKALLLSSNKSYEGLQALGIIQKIPDQIEIKAQDNFFERLAKAWKEVKKDETRKRNSKRKRSKKSSKSSV